MPGDVASTSVTDLIVDVDGGAHLAGSLWSPQRPRSIVLMIPGSGPSTRHNDTYFPPIRERFLGAGHAVAAFDKRGAGASTGSMRDTSVARQALDAVRCVEALRTALPELPIGAFGHSQGGWVAYELAVLVPSLGFAISNSGPAVGPAVQERARLMNRVEVSERHMIASAFDDIVAVARTGGSVENLHEIIATAGFDHLLHEYVADGVDGWVLETALLRYEPAAALNAITVPTLVIHGADDSMIPVADSLAMLERIANPNISCIRFAGGDHRLVPTVAGHGFVPGYFEALLGFLERALDEPS